jgi:uroporphyrin-III C-methyltransferase/precorrin-2 dehydrogenase/sirohydrochlorin ferrochelatase
MESLPIFIKVKNARCLMIGGGEVALRKVTTLLKAGADIEVIAPELCHELADLRNDGRIEHQKTAFNESHLVGATLVFAATDDDAINMQISNAAKALNIPVNVVDAPALCTFTMPSIVDRSPVVIAVSSNGSAPVLARMIRTKIETMVPASYGRLANLARDFRETVKSKFSTMQSRRIFWEKVFQGPIAELVFSGQESAAKAALAEAIARDENDAQHGEVYLVGGGPGDPDLLTFRALRL